MKNPARAVAFGILILGVTLYGAWRYSTQRSVSVLPLGSHEAMIITSSAFTTEETIPIKFTCDGGDINPELLFHNVPENAKSLALIMDDPDAPSGTFTHWMLWNIDPKTQLIKQESIPPGSVQGLNSAGSNSYMGPCPPPGTSHHYRFKAYALDASLSVPADISKEELEEEIERHMLARAELVGIYGRE